MYNYTASFILTILTIVEWFILIDASTYYYFMPSINAVPPTPPPPSPLLRTIYYPMRTNCQSRCIPQTRYRWNYRITGGVENPYAPPFGAPQPYIQLPFSPKPTDLQTLSPYQPPPENSPFSQVSSYQGSLVTLSTSPPISQTISTQLPAASTPFPKLFTYFSTSETSSQKTIEDNEVNPLQNTPTIKAITELPTPPPYIQINQNVPMKRPNPCPSGKPLVNELQNAVTCNFIVKPNSGCPENYWCHTGSSFETTTCCPNYNLKERCNLPRTSGEGDDLIPRWYYDISMRKCKRFLYKGLKGNPNNFITSIQCMETCETADRAAAYKNPCASGPPARNLDGNLFQCGPYSIYDSIAKKQGKCPAGYYCHVGESAETTVCCEHSSVRDSCLLTINEGEGNANLQRYYYDIATKKCIKFSYRGIRGNENNFISYLDCKQECIKYNNPCPVLFDYGGQKQCSSENPETCNKHEWCHVGSNSETTACCPGAVLDPCKLPLDLGQGDENLTRWYADSSEESCKGECRAFDYRGTKGNQNNFLTKHQCESACKPVECSNLCSSGKILLEPGTHRPKQCNMSSPCPVNYWCHFGATEETTVCCTSVKRSCNLPMEEGFGKAVLSRWYYNKRDQNCRKFVYKGIGGNQNSYVSKEDCLNACPIYDNPCGSGYPLLIANRPKVCSPEHRCPFTHFCHIGIEGAPNYCCSKNGDPCEHPIMPGQGAHAIQRFYFNAETRQCAEFMYKGKKGNANNFLSMEDCELVCQASTTRNPCHNGTPLLNDTSGDIMICGGEEQCPTGYWCHVGGAPETTNCCPLFETNNVCELSSDSGQGVDQLERWYFDSTQQICKRFIYLGVKGNANNFLTMQSCQEACPGFNPCLIGKPLTDKDGEILTCLPEKLFDSCPTPTSYCHASTNPAAENVCCIRIGSDPCESPPNYGVGAEPAKRWYHNSALNKCEAFQYAGLQGNENNFVSKEVCEQNCPRLQKYCPHGSPLLEKLSSQPVKCGITKGCPQGYVCHMDPEHQVAVCCEDPGHFCLHAREAGPCDKEENRYGYNPLTDTCVPYSYSGCGGTLNNFKTLERCTEICCREYRHRLYS